MNGMIDRLNSFSEAWSSFVWHSSWQSTLIVLLAMLVVIWGRKWSPNLRYGILAIALLKFAVPPFLAAPTGAFSALPETRLNQSKLVAENSIAEHTNDFNIKSHANLEDRLSQNHSNVDYRNPMRDDSNSSPSIEHVVTVKPPRTVQPHASEFNREISPVASTPKNEQADQQSGIVLAGAGSLSPSKIHQQTWLMLVHLTGLVVLLCYLLVNLFRLEILRHRAQPITESETLKMFQQACQNLGLKSPPALLESREIRTPISYGCFRPVVLLPQNFSKEKTQTVAAIGHELAHLRRWDPWVNFLQNVMLMVWWINPMIWVLNWHIRKIREYCCDDLILTSGLTQSESYSRSLIDIAKNTHNEFAGPVATAFGMADHPLAERIKRIMNPNVRRRAKISWIGAITMLVLAAVCLPGIRNAVSATHDPSTLEKSNTEEADLEHRDAETSPRRKTQEDEKGKQKLAKSFQIKVLDQNNKPMSGVNVYANCSGTNPATGDPKVVSNNYTTNADGIVTVPIFDGCTRLRSWIRKKGHVTLFANWEDRVKNDVPKLLTVKLQPGTSIGGTVVDPDGKPIAGVSVEVMRRKGGTKLDTNQNTRLGTWLASRKTAVITGKDGKWQINNVPAGNDLEFRFHIVHPEYITASRWQDMGEMKVTTKQLRNKTAKLALQPGIQITGTVVDSLGNPVEDALIVWGDRPYWQQGSQETKTNAKGEFKTQAQPEGEIRLTVVAEHWMPQTRKIKLVKSADNSQKFELQPGKKLHLKFIDQHGDPVPRTYVSIDQWRGSEALYNSQHPNVVNSKIPYIGDDEGEFIWNWAPNDKVKYRVYNRLLNLAKEFTLTATDEVQIIRLTRPFAFNGTVVDDQSGAAVTGYTITPINFYSGRSRGIAQRMQKRTFETNKFDLGDVNRIDDGRQFAYRIDAVGYQSFTTQKFTSDSPSKPIEIRLKPSEIRFVKFVDQQGNPVKDVRTWVVDPYESLLFGRFADYLRNYQNPDLSRSDGKVFYGTPVTNHAIVGMTKEGYAEKYLAANEKAGTLTLQPWARLKGGLFQAGKPVAGATIVAAPIRNLGGDNPHVQDIFMTKTDASGRFEFDRLPPVPIFVRSVLSAWADYPITSNKSVPLILKPGKTHTVNLGGEGLQIQGRIKINGDRPDDLQFRYGINNLAAVKPSITLPKHARNPLQYDVGEQKRYEERLWGNPKTRAAHESYYVKINDDGTFLINGVRPGKYRFLIKLYAPPKGCLVSPIGYGFVEFSTDDYVSKNNTIDLGAVEVKMKQAAKVGDTLPSFAYQDLAGKRHAISEHRGKYVLLDFWASWCKPCIAEMPELRKLHQEIKTLKNAKLLSISLDSDPQLAKKIVQSKKLTWSQGTVGDIREQESARLLGVSSVPYYILLDPQGKIVARTYNFSEISEKLKSLVKRERKK